MTTMKTLISCTLLMLLAGTVNAATWRCGSALASSGDSTAEVLSKCGEPNNRAFIGYKEQTDSYGFTHEVQIEEWNYGPRNGMNYFLRFEGNRLNRIDSKRGD
ncbi:DUF2845 domain-containing protein [Pseudomonas sp. MM211]|uniref:DUF2845 domain-containing protein n=1 Tax=Pseudomonas sp. MM211 TaxID=2866808 RepID=UPI001CEDDD2D|nr:DUF2845 domain-containing protein [Pseudomonas sp. MM211]UCJ18634.1 DUF2845 domain-containing protein [Pseudomonas sp. MM211]